MVCKIKIPYYLEFLSMKISKIIQLLPKIGVYDICKLFLSKRSLDPCWIFDVDIFKKRIRKKITPPPPK